MNTLSLSIIKYVIFKNNLAIFKGIEYINLKVDDSNITIFSDSICTLIPASKMAKSLYTSNIVRLVYCYT